jgi:hypothetical protein
LGADGAEHVRGRYAAAVHDPTGGDHGYGQGVDHHRHESHCADQRSGDRREKSCSVRSGLGALRHYEVRASIL